MQEVHLGSNFHWFEHGGFHCSIVPHHWSSDCETYHGKLNHQGHTIGGILVPSHDSWAHKGHNHLHASNDKHVYFEMWHPRQI